MRLSIIRKIPLLSIVLMTACAPPMPAPEAPENKVMPLEQRKAETAKVSSWEISGAIAAKNKNKAWTASINWLQKGINNYQIRLFGPLGSGSIIIDKKGSKITYRDGPKTITSHNASQLLEDQTGIRLPVNDLYYWVRGLPAPHSVGSSSHDRYSHLKQLSQDGYTVNYLKYTSVKGKDLPSMIRLTGHGVQIKLVIKNWRV